MFVVLLCAALASPAPIAAASWPPRNPYLVDGVSAMPHFDSAAQDSTPIAGPTGFVDLGAGQVRRLAGGIGNGVYVSAPPSASGIVVVWTVNSSRVAKIRIDGGRFDEVASYALPHQPQVDADAADDIVGNLDRAQSEDDLVAFVRARLPFWLERVGVRAGIYPLMDRDGNFYVVANGEVLVFRDENGPLSPIALDRRWPIPPEILSDWTLRWHAVRRWWSGSLARRGPNGPTWSQALEILRDTALGLGMTWDGRLIVSTISGGIAVVDRQFRDPPQWLRLDGELVTNSIAVDEGGGIYVVTDQRMHKLVWTGARLSRDEKDGAWSSPYTLAGGALGGIRAGSQGSGSTPTLMGFGPQEDHLVVITDGAAVMSLVAFWRDAIPDGFVQKPGTASRRIADQRPVTFAQPGITASQSEQSVAVWGYGAFVVNNAGADSLPSAFENVVTLGVTRPAPKGIEKLLWDPAKDAWELAWARADIGSPSSVPLVSGGSSQAYVQDVHDGRFELIGLDWNSGEIRTRLVFPKGQAFNGAYTQIQLLPDGDVFMGMLAGPVRTLLHP